MQPDRDVSSKLRTPTVLSALTHIVALVAILGVLHHAPTLAAYKFPGTRSGTELLTYYAPGSASMAQNDLPVKAVAKPKAASATHSPAAPPQPQDTTSAPSTERGAENSAQSGLGDGDITIALQKYFPYPKPSLSTLPRGAAGDVILTATIDEHGRISGLVLVHGLGPDIDNQVIQTVNQWVYTPATRNGVPVASVQELHFHYERSA
jgi:protein TonB